MSKINYLKYFLCALFICAISETAFSHNTTFNSTKGISMGISQDSISKAEIADYRKNFESVEKIVYKRIGTYAEARSSFNSISGSRVRNLPEFSGRYSALQQKLAVWNAEINPKEPPIKVPNDPKTPKVTAKVDDKAKEVETTVTEVERKSLMNSYFPDTITVGTDFTAYVEISKENSVQSGNTSVNINSGTDIISIGSSALRTAVMSSLVTVELTKDGGVDNFTISPRSGSNAKTINDNERARWEWLIHPNAEGESRLRLNVTYQKQNPDGSVQQVSAITKVIVVKALPRKTEDNSNSLPWIILGLLVVLGLIGYILYTAQKNKRGKTKNYEHREVHTEHRDIDKK